MLLAELAVLGHFKPFGVVFLAFFGVVVSLLAFCARKRNLFSHFGTS
jgi:hypothetical protein